MIIQGGMGVAVSNWRLAQAVSRLGQLGVISGTAIDAVLVRRLQDGDPGGHMRRAMARFPIAKVAEEALERYFKPEGRAPGEPYTLLPMPQQVMTAFRDRFTMLASFVEVSLAKEGHSNPVGMNLLTKIQIPNLALLYGAMIAGVDFVLMGAGIPIEIPKALDALALQRPAAIRLEIEGAGSDRTEYVRLDPASHWPGPAPELYRPRFLPIISSNSLATLMTRKAGSRVDGFIIEGPTAGGHNAPPRGELKLNERSEPIYGERDVVDLAKLRDLGLPFWIAGGGGSPERLEQVLAEGATGVQVGTLFAYCDESGFDPTLKRSIVEHARRREVDVHTDALASPTGFPFKVVHWAGDPSQNQHRERVCDLGYLRVAYPMENGRLGYRCPSEPVDAFLAKGGRLEDTVGRKCLCNALLASIGLPQAREDGYVEQPVVTSGDDLMNLHRFLGDRDHYTAADVVEYLLSRRPVAGSAAPGA